MKCAAFVFHSPTFTSETSDIRKDVWSEVAELGAKAEEVAARAEIMATFK